MSLVVLMLNSIPQLAAGFAMLLPQMDMRLTRLLVGSYLGIVITLVGGTMLMPQLFMNYPHRGISFWGNYWPAVIPYSAGLLTSAICMACAAYVLPDYPERLGMMRRLLLALALGLAVILLTPEQANTVTYWAHTLGAIYLFTVAGIGAAWIMLHAGKTALDWMLFWMLVTGSMLSLLSASYVRVLGLLAFGQVLALISSSLLITRAALRWSVQEVKE